MTWRDVRISAFPPEPDPLADAVDVVVLLDAVLRPFGVECELLCPSSWAGRSGRSMADPAGFDDFVGDPFVAEAEMPSRFPKGELMIGFSMTT